MSLNKAQTEAVHIRNGPAMILAGPGSGKTTVIINRIRCLIEEYEVDPAKILVITFTRSAASEMQSRFTKLLDGRPLPVVFGTFHAVFFSILRETLGYTAKDIIKTSERREILQDVVRQVAPRLSSEKESLDYIAEEISNVKGLGLSLSEYVPKSCEKECFLRIYRGFEAGMRNLHKLDFDDMVGMTLDLFRKRPEVLAVWKKKFEYILVDEFQDISPMQYAVLRLLALPGEGAADGGTGSDEGTARSNLLIVGDDDQSIYRFRGAEPGIMLNFPNDYPNLKTVLLETNYRSGGAIVADAVRLIEHNKKRFSKNLQAAAPMGLPPIYSTCEDAEEENRDILQKIRELESLGIPKERMAVLYRTRRTARSLIELFETENMPFTMEEQLPDLYSHWVTGDLMGYMALAEGTGTRKDLIRIINHPSRYISRNAMSEPVTLDRIRSYYRNHASVLASLDNLERHLRMISKMSAYGAINFIRRGIGYDEFLKTYAAEHGLRADELLDIAEEVQESAKGKGSYRAWLEHLKELEAATEDRKKVPGGITISTMHRSKGLEYEAVFIPDANEGLTPHKRCTDEDSIEEERRLFYVAMTRAKTYLYIYHTKDRYNRNTAPSRFIAEARGERAETDTGIAQNHTV